jgi:hypothetical protein
MFLPACATLGTPIGTVMSRLHAAAVSCATYSPIPPAQRGSIQAEQGGPVICGKARDIDCTRCSPRCGLFLDSERDRERRALLARHLDECAPCPAEYGLDEKLKRLLAAFLRVPRPSEVIGGWVRRAGTWDIGAHDDGGE